MSFMSFLSCKMEQRNNEMKVVRVTHTNLGGAGLCVQRLHNAYNSLYGDETLIIADGIRHDETILIAEKDGAANYNKRRSYLGTKIYHLLLRLKLVPQETYFREKIDKLRSKRDFFLTLPFSGYKHIIELPCVKNADIINLHWIGNFVDLPSFATGTDKPIVWSLHDENPARGCLHYECPYPEYNDLDRELQDIKIKAIKKINNLNVVVQSKKMKETCLKSKVLADYPITIIPNGVNVNQFKLKDKIESRKELGISREAKVFLFSSVDIYDERKGLIYLISALERLNDSDVVLVCVGRYDKIPQAKIEVKCVGFVDDYNKYSNLYSASDFYVLSSFQESFAKTPLEAMSCGTPVVAFPCSGVEDCITDDTGVICNDFTIDALYEGIQKAQSKVYDREKIRNHVKENFTFEIMARRYRTLYESILRE